MTRSIVEFGAGHIAEAAHLLAARHIADRSREPLLPEVFGQAATCRRLIEALRARGFGVAAFDGSRMVGYLICENAPVHHAVRRAFLPLEGHAVAADQGPETYREMYAVLAPMLLGRGLFDHQVFLPASDVEASGTWFSLGFGQRFHIAHRGLEPLQGNAAPVEVRRAGPAGIDDVMRLFYALSQYTTASPIFEPYVFDAEGWRREVEGQIASDEIAFFLAYRANRAVGVMNLGPPRQEGMFRPEGCVHLWEAFVEPDERSRGLGTALLAKCVEWARDSGHTGITLDFMTFNPLGAPFWQGHGFRPVATILQRRIDPRVVWATGLNG